MCLSTVQRCWSLMCLCVIILFFSFILKMCKSGFYYFYPGAFVAFRHIHSLFYNCFVTVDFITFTLVHLSHFTISILYSVIVLSPWILLLLLLGPFRAYLLLIISLCKNQAVSETWYGKKTTILIT